MTLSISEIFFFSHYKYLMHSQIRKTYQVSRLNSERISCIYFDIWLMRRSSFSKKYQIIQYNVYICQTSEICLKGIIVLFCYYAALIAAVTLFRITSWRNAPDITFHRIARNGDPPRKTESDCAVVVAHRIIRLG